MRLFLSFVFGFSFLGYCFLVSEGNHRATVDHAPAAVAYLAPPVRTTRVNSLPSGVIRLYCPGGPPVFVGPMLTGEVQRGFLRGQGIARVVRLNLEARALRQQDTTAQRRAIRPVTLHCFNIDAAPAGQLNEAALREIGRLIRTSPGPVYVHCQNGVHRAKLVGGLHYAALGYRPETIYDLLDWWDVVRNRKYKKYVTRVRRATSEPSLNTFSK